MRQPMQPAHRRAKMKHRWDGLFACAALLAKSMGAATPASVIHVTTSPEVAALLPFNPPIRPVSAEAVADYASGEPASFNDLDLGIMFRSLASPELSPEDLETWQQSLMLLVTHEGALPQLLVHPSGGTPSGGSPLHTTEEYAQMHAIDALFRLSTPADDPGLVAAYQDPDVPLFLRQHIWEKLVSEWGMASLPPPGEG